MGVVIRKTISTSIINYLGVLLGVVNVLWLQTAIISELEIGILNYVVDVTILLLPFILFGTSGLPSRFIHIFEKQKDRNGFINLLFLIPLITIGLSSVVFSVFKEPIVHGLGEDAVNYKEYLVFIIPLLFCYSYQYLIEAILATKSLTVFSSFLKNIYRRAVLMGLLIAYSFSVIDFYQLVTIYVMGHFVEVIVLFLFFKNRLRYKLTLPKLSIGVEKRREIVSYAFYLIIGVSGVVMVGKIDSVMISGITDDFKLLGVYAIAFFIATIIELPKRIVHQLIFPIMSRLVTDNNKTELHEMYRQSGINMAIIGVFLFLLIWFSIDELFLIIPNGEIYSAGRWVVFFIGISKVLDVVFGSTDLIINATQHYKWNGILIPFLVLTTFITNYYFINKYGIIGAAVATSITVFLYSLVKYMVVLIKLKMNLITKEYLYILITLGTVVFIFYYKPQITNNNFIEIVLNSLLITIIFIGGNYVMKSSKEMNHLISSNIKRILGK